MSIQRLFFGLDDFNGFELIRRFRAEPRRNPLDRDLMKPEQFAKLHEHPDPLGSIGVEPQSGQFGVVQGETIGNEETR